MREALSKRSKATTKTTTKNKASEKLSAKLSGSNAQTKLMKSKAKTASKPKASSTSKVKAKSKPAALKSVKPAPKVQATKKAVSKTSKPAAKVAPKVAAKKPLPKTAATKKVTKRVASTAKTASKTAKVNTKAATVVRKTVAPASGKPLATVSLPKVVTRKPSKLALPIRVAPPPPPEPPRRTSTAAALRMFEHAVRVFNRRHFEEAKEMFETLQAKYPNEIEIITRSQMYLQVCSQKLANMPSTPRNADELYDRGVYALNIGDFSQAKNFFEKALRLKPEEPHLLYSLAATLAQTGSHDQALDYLKRTIQIQPRYRAQALNDSDFSELRENKQFLELLGLASPFDILQAKR